MRSPAELPRLAEVFSPTGPDGAAPEIRLDEAGFMDFLRRGLARFRDPKRYDPEPGELPPPPTANRDFWRDRTGRESNEDFWDRRDNPPAEPKAIRPPQSNADFWKERDAAAKATASAEKQQARADRKAARAQDRGHKHSWDIQIPPRPHYHALQPHRLGYRGPEDEPLEAGEGEGEASGLPWDVEREILHTRVKATGGEWLERAMQYPKRGNLIAQERDDGLWDVFYLDRTGDDHRPMKAVVDPQQMKVVAKRPKNAADLERARGERGEGHRALGKTIDPTTGTVGEPKTALRTIRGGTPADAEQKKRAMIAKVAAALRKANPDVPRGSTGVMRRELGDGKVEFFFKDPGAEAKVVYDKATGEIAVEQIAAEDDEERMPPPESLAKELGDLDPNLQRAILAKKKRDE